MNNYLQGRPSLNVSEQTQILYSLSRLAFQAGADDRAASYQQRAVQKAQENAPPSNDPGPLAKALSAANRSDFAGALSFAMQALAGTPQSPASVYTLNQLMDLSAQLAAANRADLGDQLYVSVLAAAESWSVDTMQPLLSVLHQRADFLLVHQLWPEAQPVIERYRDALAVAYAAESGRAQEGLHLQIRLDEGRKLWPRAVVEAQDLLANQAALNGTKSADYYGALEIAAGVYESSGNPEAALPLFRQQVQVADRIFGKNERACVRVNASSSLARAGQFEEAERLASEAAALLPAYATYATHLDAIRLMKTGGPQVGLTGCGFGGTFFE